MQAEEDIVSIHGVHSIGMLKEELLLDVWHPQEADVEYTVRNKAGQIQSHKVKAQADDTFPPVVLDHLRIEGDRPGHKVDPSNHLVDDANGVTVGHQEDYPRTSLFGMISVQVNGNLSNILRCHLKRGISDSRRHHNFIRELNDSDIFRAECDFKGDHQSFV